MAKEKIREEKEKERAAQAAYDDLEKTVKKLNQREEQILKRLEDMGKLKFKDKKKQQENQTEMRKLVTELNTLRQEKAKYDEAWNKEQEKKMREVEAAKARAFGEAMSKS